MTLDNKYINTVLYFWKRRYQKTFSMIKGEGDEGI
jgi:hypothetical protein